MAEESDILIEVEAAESVYGDDCVVYPDEPPEITIIDSKGLDGKRQKDLITSVREKGCELSSNSMLVALCEEAVEKLTSMNHPDGDCPMCLHPLVEEGVSNDSLPFMKLMSCFHCFHCSSGSKFAHRQQKTKTQQMAGKYDEWARVD
ncbi:E3 ubiquitin protein ligase RNF25 [Tanacetum coccineum]